MCGSYVTGQPSKRSDVDLHLVLSETCEWRQRGNLRCGGFLIEYFANPPRQVRAYFAEDHQSNCRMAATQFVTGRILFDKDGDVARLKREATRWLRKPFTKPDKTGTEAAKYSLWDGLDNLREGYDQGSADFVHVYHAYLRQILTAYCKALGVPVIAPNQTYSILTKTRTRRKYRLQRFPDGRFVKIYLSGLIESNRARMIADAENLSAHVSRKLGGFEIDGWKLRTPATPRKKRR